MPLLARRHLLALTGAAAALPRFAIAQSDARPEITVAVQALVTSNTLDPVAEQSNVGERILNSYVELLIGRNLQGSLEQMPQLATSWHRIDDHTLEVSLRQGVRFHNGDELTAEDVVFTFGPEHMFGTTLPSGMDKTLRMDTARPTQQSKTLPPQVPAVGRRLWPSLDKAVAVDKYTVRFINVTPDVTMEGRLSQMGSQIINRRAFEAAESWLAYARQPVGTGPYKVRRYTPDVELIFDAHDEYLGRPATDPHAALRASAGTGAAREWPARRAVPICLRSDSGSDQSGGVGFSPGRGRRGDSEHPHDGVRQG